MFLRLYREATKFHNGKNVKDLSHLNRDLKKVILIDDDPSAFQLQPSNAIRIKPYENAYDKDDHELENLLPFLAALVNEKVSDFPAVIRSFRSNEAQEISRGYKAKLDSVKFKEEEAQTRGLGLMLRSVSVSDKKVDSTMSIDMSGGASKASVHKPHSSPSPNGAPLADGQKGSLWKKVDNFYKSRDEEQKKKFEEYQARQQL